MTCAPATTADRHPDGYAHTDVGNAERLRDGYSHRLRYVHPWKIWLVWDGARWRSDDTGAPRRLAVEAIRAMRHEAAELADPRARDQLWDHARASERRERLNAALDLAQPYLAVTPEHLDGDPYLLNCPKGTIDLRTGELHAHRRDDLLTKVAGTTYQPDSFAPGWQQFLRQVLPDPELREFVRRLVGATLVGEVLEHILPVVYGSGANGKSTLVETIAHVLGDYSVTVDPQLMLAGYRGHPTSVADLLGARLAVTGESDEGARLSEGLVKQLTGGDTLTARRMRQDFFNFHPSHTLWLVTNHRPDVTGTDHGIWRRLRLIPFEHTVTEPDPHLPQTLRDEAPGILAWAVNGCLAWQQHGLNYPDRIDEVTRAYRTAMDVVGQWVDENLVEDPDATTPFADLYSDFLWWCELNHERKLSKRALSERLTDRGFPPARGSRNKPVRHGLRSANPFGRAAA